MPLYYLIVPMPRQIGLQLVAGGGVCAYLAMITYLEVNLLWDRFGAQRRSNVSDCRTRDGVLLFRFKSMIILSLFICLFLPMNLMTNGWVGRYIQL